MPRVERRTFRRAPLVDQLGDVAGLMRPGGDGGDRRLPARLEAVRAARRRVPRHPPLRSARNREDPAPKAVANASGANFYRRAHPRSSRCSRALAQLGRKLFEGARKKRPRSSSSTNSTRSDGAHGARPRPRAGPVPRPAARRARQLRRPRPGDRHGRLHRLQALVPALLRPGRFDRQCWSRRRPRRPEQILRVHTRGKPLASDVDLRLDRPSDCGSDRRRPREHHKRGRDLRGARPE